MSTLTIQPCERWIRFWSLLLLVWIAGALALAAGGVLATHDLLMPALIIITVAGFALA